MSKCRSVIVLPSGQRFFLVNILTRTVPASDWDQKETPRGGFWEVCPCFLKKKQKENLVLYAFVSCLGENEDTIPAPAVAVFLNHRQSCHPQGFNWNGWVSSSPPQISRLKHCPKMKVRGGSAGVWLSHEVTILLNGTGE